MKKLFLIFPILCACTNDLIISQKNIVSHCPKKWTESLSNTKNCSTKEFYGIRINTCWKGDKRYGPECSYHENGLLFNETNWLNDKQDGFDIDYFDNGNIKRVRIFVNNEMRGRTKGFYENGNIMFDGYYNKFCDVKYGTCYTEDGIAVPLEKEDLNKCFRRCEDIINRVIKNSD